MVADTAFTSIGLNYFIAIVSQVEMDDGMVIWINSSSINGK